MIYGSSILSDDVKNVTTRWNLRLDEDMLAIIQAVKSPKVSKIKSL